MITIIQIKRIYEDKKEDINIPNEPFEMFGIFTVTYCKGVWEHKLIRYASDKIEEMCFPNESYNYDNMSDSIFLGAYDGEKCVGLAILQPGLFKYMYLYDIKVNKEYRGRQIGKSLLDKARVIAKEEGYAGIYTLAQDNNPAACLFYLNSGFYIGGLDTNVYRHTNQEGKADVVFYCDLNY